MKDSQDGWNYNLTTHTITKILGIILAISGFEHGLFEALQGYKATEGFIIQAIGEEMQWWQFGGEEAFTLIPNFLLTGIAAMAVSLFIIYWSHQKLKSKYGIPIFLFLFILLTLVGGGIGFTPFYLITWAYGTRMKKTLQWWQEFLPETSWPFLARIWRFCLVVVGISWFLALEIAIFGYFPGQSDPTMLLTICWSFLFIAFVFINLAYISGFARDIELADATLKNTAH